jgi:hypothetical protein
MSAAMPPPSPRTAGVNRWILLFWHLVFFIAAAMNGAAAIMALVVLKPMRLRRARADAGLAEHAAPARAFGGTKLA